MRNVLVWLARYILALAFIIAIIGAPLTLFFDSLVPALIVFVICAIALVVYVVLMFIGSNMEDNQGKDE